MKCILKDDSLIIKQSAGYTVLGVYLIAFSVLVYIAMVISSMENDGLETILIAFFLATISLFGGLWYILAHAGHQLILDANGIREVRLFRKKKCFTYEWKDIQDWGCSYFRTVNGNSIYYLYFSDHPLSVTGIDSKAVTKHCTKIELKNRHIIKWVIPVIIPFCRRYLDIAPFSPFRKE